MTDKLFAKLWKDAVAQPDKDMYIGEYGYPDYFSEISDDPEEVLKVLGNIHDIAHMSFRDILIASSLTHAAFSEKFLVPKRTVDSWCMEERKCADYVKIMICRQLGLLEV